MQEENGVFLELACNRYGLSFQIAVVPTFAEFVIGRRTVLGISERRGFAQRANVSETSIWEIETSKGKPFHLRRDDTRARIADALQVPLQTLDAFSRGDESVIASIPFVQSKNAPESYDDEPLRKLGREHGIPLGKLLAEAMALWQEKNAAMFSDAVSHDTDPAEATRKRIGKLAQAKADAAAEPINGRIAVIEPVGTNPTSKRSQKAQK